MVAAGDGLLGDGVVVAARLEPPAEPGGIRISARVREDAADEVKAFLAPLRAADGHIAAHSERNSNRGDSGLTTAKRENSVDFGVRTAGSGLSGLFS